MKHIISVKQFLDKKLLQELFKSAEALQSLGSKDYPKSLENKIVATLFYEPSTRTRLSFETAVQRLGGNIISTENAGQFSSAIKGESLEDTIRTINGYADAIVLRHPEVGAAERSATVSEVPIINAGDGAGEHPTQSLLDLYTIIRAKGTADNLQVGLFGDLRNSRTIHSLIHLLALYKVKIFFVTLPQLQIPKLFLDYLDKHDVPYELKPSFADCLDQLDVIYMTRIQKERFANSVDYETAKKDFMSYKSLEKNIALLKKDAIVLDPLPRTEGSDVLDADPRAIYFEQARNGLYVRMALLDHIFSS